MKLEVDQPYHFRARLHMPVMNNDIENSQLNDYKSSQECTIETSQGSSWSYDSSTLPERNFELLNTTLSSLSHGAVSPLRSKLSTPFIESADRTKRYYKCKAGQLISTLLDTIAPGQGDILLDAMSNDKKVQRKPHHRRTSPVQLFVCTMNQQIQDTRILNACSASKRSCLKGLDNISAEGSAAFDTYIYIISEIEKMRLLSAWSKAISSKLKSYKMYLKTDFKLHLEIESRCADHCLQWALSDTTDKSGNFKVHCLHKHDISCDRCSLLENFKLEMQNAFRQLPPTEQLKDLQYDFETAIAKIDEWKKHILRTVNQARAKTDILDNLQSHQMLIIMDWAMKYLPNMFLGKQSDWYGQKGKNWHVIVGIFKNENKDLKHRTFVHIIDSAKQDWYSVSSLLLHALTTIKRQLPEIKEVFLRSDNEGCYKCGQIWLVMNELSQQSGITIRRYDYSEPQSGKSYCDAKIAHMRGKMQVYILNGNNINTAKDMKTAIDYQHGVSGVQSSVVAIKNENLKFTSHKWKGITNFNNLEFLPDGIKVWKAYNVGSGRFYRNDELDRLYPNVCKQEQFEVVEIDSFSSPKNVEGNIKLQKDKVENAENITAGSPKHFFCSEPGCIIAFKSFSSLEQHIFIGKHDYRLERESTYDSVKRIWADQCNNINNEVNICLNNLSAGHEEAVVIGQLTGRKVEAIDVVHGMRSAVTEDGNRRFDKSDWLQVTQITAFLSRLAHTSCSSSKKDDGFTLDALVADDDDDLRAIATTLDAQVINQELESLDFYD
ncbi:unnamed protein product [Mytilus coruscus]|uniref:C2H2-type domain-containing protein n=1 Tax=Mytilus coruscus TaxID=42192 RepID=A0A6J8ALH6_MYTCO|nr:unnamed protein product [Mytilus coruscus]